MNITYGVLLLIIGGLTLWLLTESKIRWYIKTGCITVFCIFTLLFWNTVHDFLGWPAQSNAIPEKVKIHWIIIQEPDKITETPGAIYMLAEAPQRLEPNRLLRIFGYSNRKEPRQYGLPYDRKLHEQLAKNVIPRLKKGHPVFGKLTEIKGDGKKKGNGKTNEKGGGSESQEQRFEFHELRPSDFLRKPTD